MEKSIKEIREESIRDINAMQWNKNNYTDDKVYSKMEERKSVLATEIYCRVAEFETIYRTQKQLELISGRI